MTIASRWGSCSLHFLNWDTAVWLEDGRTTWIILAVTDSETAPTLFFLRLVVWQ